MGKSTVLIVLGVGAVGFLLLTRQSQTVPASPYGPMAGSGAPSNNLQAGAQIASSLSGALQGILGAFGGSASSDATDSGD